MSDEFLNRLRGADPASDAQPDLDALRARVFAHVDDNVVTFSPRTARLRALRYAAAVALLGLAAGGGYWGGHASTSSTEATGYATFSNASGKVTATTGLGGGGEVAAADRASTMSSTSAQSSYAGWWGNTILKPASSVPNAAGEAMAYRFTSAGLDRLALAKAIARVVGLDPSKVSEGQAGMESIVGNSSLQVDNSTQANFWANNSADRNPYTCGLNETAVSPETAKGDMKAVNEACLRDWAPPSKADAIAQVKQSLASLDLPLLEGARYAAVSRDDRAVSVQVTPVFNGLELGGSTFWVQVSKEGVFGLNGFAAHLEPAMTYPIDGARDVANRSQLRKWASFGPTNVTPQTEPYTYQEQASGAPTTPTRDGRPMVQAWVAEIDVQSASHALQQQWLLDGQTIFLPAWNYTASDGSIWQMLAITADYIDWNSANVALAKTYAR